ncbi:LysR family transcriptional regulator [Ammonicoccus fulvus]|uniref:LysR family transcriptional regulator n=1 Tax=Ammonicoccus fulvus TaxID=3138240 RepID=A0ABZ3FLQ0_9ACTN
MELQQLRYVLAVAEHRNFTRAASACFVVQSALSHQVAKLEAELGVALFARTSRRVEVTVAGAAFLPWARQALDAAERAATEARAAEGIVAGPLTIGLIPTMTALDLPRFITKMRDTYPEVSVKLRIVGSDESIAGVRDGKLDLALIGLADGIAPQGVAHELIASETLVAVLPQGHRLANRSALTLADLADEPFADFAVGGPGRAQSDRAFAAAGLGRTVPYEASTPELICSLVEAGLCVALLSQAVVQNHGVRTVEVTDGPRRNQHLIWNGFDPTPTAQAALGIALRSGGEHTTQ